MKKFRIFLAAFCLILGVVVFGCAKLSAATSDGEDPALATADTGEVEEDEEEAEFEFTAQKEKLKCGKTYRFKTNRDDVVWSVSNKKKAVISKKGNLRAKRYGKVRVIATSGSKTISCVVKLVPKKTIGIDPGHQIRGNNGTEPIGPGSSTMKTKVAGGTSGVSTKKPEYQLTLEIGLALKEELKNRGYKVVLTRSVNEVDITNIERAQKLNKSCDVAIRLHADGGASSARGASVLSPASGNPYVAYLADKSGKLSNSIISAYCQATGLKNRGLSLRDDLTGTNWSTIPVTLLEMGFMTNSSDDNFMSSADGQKKMVSGIANGIDDYFGY